METRKIYEGDIILVELFDEKLSDTEKLKIINKDDILLLYFNDENFIGHKIRVFSGETSINNELKTYYYNMDGTFHFSTNLHKLEVVKGIVKMKLD